MKQQPLPFAKRSEYSEALRRSRLISFLALLVAISVLLIPISLDIIDKPLNEIDISGRLISIGLFIIVTLFSSRKFDCIYDYRVDGNEIELFLVNIYGKTKKQSFHVNEIEKIKTKKYLGFERLLLKITSFKKKQNFLLGRNGIGQEFMDEVSESTSSEALERYVSN